MDGGEPDIPIYKVIECTGPTNTRVYKVAVYFRGKRLASSTGHSIQQAEMEAAKKALENSSELFPQLDYQKRVMAHSMKRQKRPFDGDRKHRSAHERLRMQKSANDDSNLPKQYRVRDKSKDEHTNDTDASTGSDAEFSDSSQSSNSSNECDQHKVDKNLSHKKVNHHHHHHHHDKCNHDNPSEMTKPADEKTAIVIDNEEKDSENENGNEIKIDPNRPNECDDTSKIPEDTLDISDTDVSLESGEIL